MPCAIARAADRQHNRNLHQHAHHGGQCSSRLRSEQSDRGGDGQFEEIRSAYECAWSGDRMLHVQELHQPVGELRR